MPNTDWTVTDMNDPTLEEWRWIPRYEGVYKIRGYDHGQIWSVPRTTTRGGLLKQTLRSDGYKSVSLTKDGVQETFLVHDLMAAAFLGPRPAGQEVRHGNRIRHHNEPSNLKYGTRSDNMQDALDHGTHSKRSQTHCPSDHPYDEENTRWYRGYRICIKCKRAQALDYRRGIRKGKRQKKAAPDRPPLRLAPPPHPEGAEEFWLPVPGYEATYLVSDLGRVWSIERLTSRGRRGGRILKPGRQPSGYMVVSLSQGGKARTVAVHILVAAAFIGPRPRNLEVRHLDGKPANNALGNLAYGTREENMADVLKHGTHSRAGSPCCDAGHLYTPENTIIRYWPDGTFKQRVCRICLKEWRATSRARERERAA